MSNVLKATERLNKLYHQLDHEPISVEESMFVLDLAYEKQEVNRINELLAKNRRGEISQSELAELDGLVDLGTVLSTMQSRARQTLKQAGISRP